MQDGYGTADGTNQESVPDFDDANLEALESVFVPEGQVHVTAWAANMKARVDEFCGLADMDGNQTESEWDRRFMDWVETNSF